MGGLDCLVQRNFFGSQINSFTATIAAPPCLKDAGRHTGDFQAVFIRAPAVMEAGEGVEVIAEYQLTPEEQAAAVSVLQFHTNKGIVTLMCVHDYIQCSCS